MGAPLNIYLIMIIVSVVKAETDEMIFLLFGYRVLKLFNDQFPVKQ